MSKSCKTAIDIGRVVLTGVITAQYVGVPEPVAIPVCGLLPNTALGLANKGINY